VSHFFIKKKKMTIKADVYNIESKPLIDKFKHLLMLNPEFVKQVKMSASSYGKKVKKDGKKNQDFFSVKIPAYYYYQYE
jgi:hypothetical protein